MALEPVRPGSNSTVRSPSPLSRETWALVRAAQRTPGLEVEVLSHPDGRCVVLLGEEHTMKEEAFGIGKALVSAITRRATEGPHAYKEAIWSATRKLSHAHAYVMEHVEKAPGMRGSLCDAAEELTRQEKGQDAELLLLETGHQPKRGEQLAIFATTFTMAPVAAALKVPGLFERTGWMTSKRAEALRGKITAPLSRPPRERDRQPETAPQEIAKGLLEERNITMANNVASFARGGTTLGIVGVAHLREGGVGIADLLEEKLGFTRQRGP